MTGNNNNHDEYPRGCHLCEKESTRHFTTVEGMEYRRCDICGCTFLDSSQHPGGDFERERYFLHQNEPGDQSYRNFLGRLADPLMERLPQHLQGLDYGCGPGPALAAMLIEAGHAMSLYDPFFHPDESVLNESYDFITCTEVVEHFHYPADEFRRFNRMLRPGGWLAIMTCFQEDEGSFSNWHYRRDPTHVIFYRRETFRYLADCYGWHCEIPVKDVVIIRKPCGPNRG